MTWESTFKPSLPELEERVTLEVHSYTSDVVLKIRRGEGAKYMYVCGVRGQVKGFSASSARRMEFAVRNSISEWTTLVTLTYPAEFPEDGRVCKQHLRAFLEFLRRQKLLYAWVLEFQARGAPHFHLVTTGFIDKDWVSARWYEIVGSGDERHLRAGTRIERLRTPAAAPKYMARYIGKLEQKTVPNSFTNVGRFWGTSRMPRVAFFRFEGTYREVAAYMRSMRRWNRNRLRKKGYIWKWGGLGFTLRGGARIPMQKLKPAGAGKAVEGSRMPSCENLPGL